jgi:hypothetical protein
MTSYGNAGQPLPAETCLQAIGEPAAPPVEQHLKPVMQSPSTPHGAPAPPFPGIHALDVVVSTPFWCAEHSLE